MGIQENTPQERHSILTRQQTSSQTETWSGKELGESGERLVGSAALEHWEILTKNDYEHTWQLPRRGKVALLMRIKELKLLEALQFLDHNCARVHYMGSPQVGYEKPCDSKNTHSLSFSQTQQIRAGPQEIYVFKNSAGDSDRQLRWGIYYPRPIGSMLETSGEFFF